jgi:hypothetical protein
LSFTPPPTGGDLECPRAILNFTPGPQGWNLSPRGNEYPFVHTPPGVNTLYCLEEWRVEQRISPQGIASPPRDKIHPWGTASPLRVKVCSQGLS